VTTQTKVNAWNKPYEMDEGKFWRTMLRGDEAAWTWTTSDGAAVLAIVSPVCVNGDIYLTTVEGRAKTNRLLEDPRSTITIHHETGSVTAIGHVEFDYRPEIEVMFLMGMSARSHGNVDHEGSFLFLKHMHSPDRWICKFVPEKFVTFDEEKFLAD